MKKIILVLAAIFCFSSTVQAQDYDRSIGLRLGYPAGISYKQFFSDLGAFEIIGSGRKGGYQLTVLIEGHQPIFGSNMTFLYGGGGHIGVLDKSLNVGADGIAGLEYVFRAPVAVTIDINPSLLFWDGGVDFFVGGGLTIRYLF